jgi:LysR family glycine cleavage system transcriptional activator
MTDLSRRLPPLTALLAFEAAARHENFTHAADELGRTQSAVSRQIAALEDALGAALFHRDRRAVRLTEAGRVLHQASTLGFEHIAAAVAEIRVAVAPDPATVTIASSPALTTFWLIPRLSEYTAQHPDADIRVVVLSDPATQHLESGDADLAFMWGDGSWPGRESRLLTRDAVFAVRSPSYALRGPVETVDDLAKERLLHLDAPTRGPAAWQGFLDWPAFFRALGGTETPNTQRGLHLNSFAHVMQACLGGEGVALAWRMVAQDHLDTGALVPVLDAELTRDEGYYLAWPSARPATPQAVEFRDWLLAKATERREA